MTFLIFGPVLFTRNMNLIWHSRWNTGEKKKEKAHNRFLTFWKNK